MGKQLGRLKVLLGLLVTLSLVASMVMTVPVLAQPLVFTGDVEADFTASGVSTINDNMVGDVGMPGTPPGVTGWDMKDLRLYLYSNTMYIGINVETILGDADGDGNPSVTSAYLSGLGGSDNANLGGTESAAVYFDLNQDGTWDVIGGVSGVADYSGFSVNEFSGSFSPAYNFGTPLPTHKGIISANPSSTYPDLEFSITNWSTLPSDLGLTDTSPGFTVGARLGSGDDDGIGEDYLRYYYESPGICIEKTVDCDNDGVFLDEDWGEPGDNATWKVVVTNCCNVTIYNVSVWDDLYGTLDTIAVFNVSDSVTYKYQTQVDVDTTNRAYVEGRDPTGALVSAQDWATNRIWHEVGGTALPVDKLALLAPWAALLGCAGVVASLMLRKRRQT